MRSIRRFLIIVLLATVTLINFLAALHGYRSSLAEAEKLFDAQLLQIAHLFSGKEIFASDTAVLSKPQLLADDDAIVYQVWTNDKLLLHSPNSPDQAIAPFVNGFHESNFSNFRWRVAVMPDGPGRWIQVAERIDNRFALAENVIIESVLPLVLCVPLIGVLIWLIVGWGIRPLRNLAIQLEEKHPEDLSPVTNLADTQELKQLVASVNDLLSRLACALERESRFAANAAHELRTPLSVLKVHLYNLSREGRQDQETIDQLEQGINRLGHMVEQILALHLSSQDRLNLILTPLDLVAACRQAISDNFSMFSLKQQEIELIAAGVATIKANTKSLQIMLDNLLTNACKYTPEKGSICVTIREDNRGVVLLIEDSGPGIPESEHEQVLERFYRVGGDHHSSGEVGCGLGLSIVKQVVDGHGAKIELGHSTDLGGLSVTIRFPGRERNGNDEK